MKEEYHDTQHQRKPQKRLPECQTRNNIDSMHFMVHEQYYIEKHYSLVRTNSKESGGEQYNCHYLKDGKNFGQSLRFLPSYYFRKIPRE